MVLPNNQFPTEALGTAWAHRSNTLHVAGPPATGTQRYPAPEYGSSM